MMRPKGRFVLSREGALEESLICHHVQKGYTDGFIEGRARLKRRIGLFEVTLSGLSIILGAGIGRVAVLPMISVIVCGFTLCQFPVQALLFGTALIAVGVTISFAKRVARRKTRRRFKVIGRVMEFS